MHSNVLEHFMYSIKTNKNGMYLVEILSDLFPITGVKRIRMSFLSMK